MEEIIAQKIKSLFEIFVGFFIVDGDTESIESEELLLEFFDYIDKYFPEVKPDVSFNETIINISEDEDNFNKNAEFLNISATKEEKIGIIKSISKIVFIDDDFSISEYELLEKLLGIWGIKKEDLLS